MINILNKIDTISKNIIYSITYNDEPVVSFDSIQEANYTGSANVTVNPLENGNKATEYKYNDPDTISLIGIIENSSILGQTILKNNNKASVLQILKELKKNLVAVDIKTKSGLYKNYTLTRLHIPENYENYSLLVVEMDFEEVLIIKNASQNNRSKKDNNTIDIGVVKLNAI